MDRSIMNSRSEAAADCKEAVEIDQIERISDSPSDDNNNNNNMSTNPPISRLVGELETIACSSCGHHIPINHHGGILNDLPGMPAGVRFDPTDVEILEHLEAKVQSDSTKLHPLIHEFIHTLDGESGICYTHPEKLPGLSKDGLIRHFFHRPSKAYTTGTRKRRKIISSDEDDGSGSGACSETRWHKTGKTRAVVVNGSVKGFKKILVLYTNYGRQKKPEKTKWVMHQYHLGHVEEEKDGELVLSKVFYQTQPRHSAQPLVSFKEPLIEYPQQQQPMLQQVGSSTAVMRNNSDINLEYYHHHQQQPRFISFGHHDQCVVGGREGSSPHQLVPNLGVQGDHDGASFVSLDGRNKQLKEQFEGDMRAGS